jgi:hypothetical protein
MHPTTLISLLCARPELADQLLSGTIASVRHHLDHAIGASVPITVPIIDEGAFIAVPIFVDIEDPTTAPETVRDFENGWMNLVECEADGVITVAGVVDDQDRLRIAVVPTGDRLRITFLRKAGIV